MTGESPQPQSFADPETAGLWHDYAEKRLADFGHRIDEFRSWARQFVAWVAVVIGLEVNLLPRLKEGIGRPPEPSWSAALQLLLAALALQGLCVIGAARLGFMASWVREPERPSLLIRDLMTASATEAHRMLGAYNAKSVDAYADRADLLAVRMRQVAIAFLGSICMFLAAAFSYALSFTSP